MSDLFVETVSKVDGWTVRVWDKSDSRQSLSGHWNFKYSFEECPDRESAEQKALHEIKDGSPKESL